MRSKKALYNIITNLFLQVVAVIYGFIVPKIIITNYGSDVNGLISSITQFLGYIALLEVGFGPVVKSILYKPIAKKNKTEIEQILKTSEKFFRKIALIFIIYIIILAIIYPLIINNNFSYVYTISLILIISLSTFVEYYFRMTYKLYLQAEQKTYVISIIQIISYILSVLFIILCVFMKFPIHLVKLVSGLVFIIRPLLQNLYIKKKYKINLKEISNTYEIKQKWDGMAQHIAYVIHHNTDIVLLTLFSSLKDVSIYSVHNMVTNGINTIVRSISHGVSSSFGNMIANNEIENLKNKFNLYETIYINLVTIIYSCTIILIVPFITVYTINIKDVNYINNVFGILIAVNALLYTLKNPYNDLANDAGNFKEMKKGAILESISNLSISLVLIGKYGLVGVIIGSVVAMCIRLIHLIIHINSKILYRKNSITIKKFFIMIIEIIIICIVCTIMPLEKNYNYLNWLKNSLLVFIVSCTIVICISLLFYRRELKQLLTILKKIFYRKVNNK